MNEDEKKSQEKKDSNKLKIAQVEVGSNSIRKITSVLSLKSPNNGVMLATQLGLSYSLSRLTGQPVRDLLMNDLRTINIYYFPSSGSIADDTPAHNFNDFRFRDFAPLAFQFFRNVYGIKIEDFIMSLCNKPMKELSRSGASGSLFFKSSDDLYVVKTVDHREAKFLQGLLPGYYMNCQQNKNTLLPKFFGLYLYSTIAMTFRFSVMNNLLPSHLKLDETYDIKGSTFKRRASPKELLKASPTLKDLDFLDRHPHGFVLEPEYYDLIISTLERDALVLESFKIMDYSLLIGVHDVTSHDSNECPCRTLNSETHKFNTYKRVENLSFELRGLGTRSVVGDSLNYQGGIPAKNEQGHSLLLFIGIIDILQNFRFTKKLEHRFKSLISDGRTISVNNPAFYQTRFLDFCKKKIFGVSNSDNSELNLDDLCFSEPPCIDQSYLMVKAQNTLKRQIIPEDDSNKNGNPKIVIDSPKDTNKEYVYTHKTISNSADTHIYAKK